MDPTENSNEELSSVKNIDFALLGVWIVTLSCFILVNNFIGPWPLFFKIIPERLFFLTHLISAMMFGGGLIILSCIEHLVVKSEEPSVLKFWFHKVPDLDGWIALPALTISMISGTGLCIARYGGLNNAPPHVDAIFWILIAFMFWWGITDKPTQIVAIDAVNEMYKTYEKGEAGLTIPQVILDRQLSNVVSCFFVLLLYSFMVLKPGTLFPFPWNGTKKCSQYSSIPQANQE